MKLSSSSPVHFFTTNCSPHHAGCEASTFTNTHCSPVQFLDNRAYLLPYCLSSLPLTCYSTVLTFRGVVSFIARASVGRTGAKPLGRT